MSNKIKYWNYNKETLEVDQNPVVLPKQSGMDEYPRTALLVEPKSKKDGFAVCVCNFVDGRPTDTEYVTDNRGKLKFLKETIFTTDEVRELGELDDKWTLKEPTSQFSVWDEQAGDWVDNEAHKEHFWVEEQLKETDRQLEFALDGDDRASNSEAEIRAYRKALRNYTSFDSETNTYTILGDARPTL